MITVTLQRRRDQIIVTSERCRRTPRFTGRRGPLAARRECVGAVRVGRARGERRAGGAGELKARCADTQLAALAWEKED